MTIKHLVICGGGPVGLVNYGVLKELTNSNIISYENIKSIYATSIGSFIGLIYILNMDWDSTDDYLIKRPWDKLIDFSSYDYLNLMYSKGLADKDLIIEMIKPLLLAKDLNVDITLEELYNITQIEFHIFTTNLNKFCKVDLNYKTYPTLKLFEAIMMSSSIPILIQPPYYNNEYYLDGGIFSNCPVNECFNEQKCDKNEIFAIINDKRFPIDENNKFHNNSNNDSNDDSNNLNENTNLFNFFVIILKTIFRKLMIIENENLIEINNNINVCLTKNNLDISYWKYVLTNKDERVYLLELGKSITLKFIEKNKEKNEEKNKEKNEEKNKDK